MYLFVLFLQLYSRQPFTEQEQLDAFLWHLLTKRQEQRSPAAFLFVESFRTCGSSHKCIGWCPQWAQGRMLYNFTGLSPQLWRVVLVTVGPTYKAY